MFTNFTVHLSDKERVTAVDLRPDTDDSKVAVNVESGGDYLSLIARIEDLREFHARLGAELDRIEQARYLAERKAG